MSFWWFSKPFFAFNRVGMKKNPISSKSERQVQPLLRDILEGMLFCRTGLG